MAIGGETSQTLDRGVRLLRLVADSGAPGLTITELAHRLEVGRPVVYRLVATLAEHDLVRRAPDARVRLGLGVLQLASAIHPGLRELVTPVLRELADAAGATAHLTIAEGQEATALAVVEPSWTDFHVSYRVGSRHRLDRGAAGKAIVAARTGNPAVVCTQGELQSGATGVALAVTGVPGLDASVGVVSLEAIDQDHVSALVKRAVGSVEAALRQLG